MVISDLHIGFESHIYTRGIAFDERIFFDEMIGELSDLIKSNKAQAVILLGDLKSTVGSISRLEWQKIPRFSNFSLRLQIFILCLVIMTVI